MKILEKKYLTFDDVLIYPQYSNIPSRKDVSLKSGLLDLPVIASPMDTIVSYEMMVAMLEAGGSGVLHRFCTVDYQVNLFKSLFQNYKESFLIGAAVGVKDFERIDALVKAGCWLLYVDVAHGDTSYAYDTIEYIKENYGYVKVVSGSIATVEGAQRAKDAGCDVLRIGIGSGSACTTRIKTGCGVPQLSAILECSKLGIPIIADGGIRNAGDCAKALAAGASYIMLGGMLSGTDETPGDIQGLEQSYKEFRGMASSKVNEELYSKMPSYKTAEGVSTLVPCKGPVAHVLHDIEGGLRSAFTYVGARNLEEFQQNSVFIRVSNNTVAENKPHILKN